MPILYFILSVALTSILLWNVVPDWLVSDSYVEDIFKCFIAFILAYILFLPLKIYSIIAGRYFSDSILIFATERIISPLVIIYFSSVSLGLIYGFSAGVYGYPYLVVLFIVWSDPLNYLRRHVQSDFTLSRFIEKLDSADYKILYSSFPPKSLLDTWPFFVIIFFIYTIIILKANFLY